MGHLARDARRGEGGRVVPTIKSTARTTVPKPDHIEIMEWAWDKQSGYRIALFGEDKKKSATGFFTRHDMERMRSAIDAVLSDSSDIRIKR